MYTSLIVLLVITGIIFVGAVLLMSPKGGLGVGIAGMAGGGEYGSKKSIETTLKKVAVVSAIAFVAISLFLPYFSA